MKNVKSNKNNLTSKKNVQPDVSRNLSRINPHSAGVDIGSRSHFVAVPIKSEEIIIREFGTFNDDLENLILWLKECGVTTVAMESTSTYWIPLYEKLEENGIEAVLVNASHIKNVPGRKSDVQDCQWIQKLHSYGLLRGAFRPKEDILKLRSFLRHRQSLIEHASPHVLHMQKALNQMNIQVHHAVSDILGVTGMKIIHAILAGERDCKKLAELRDYRCKNDKETIARALNGNFKEEYLFILRQSLKMHQSYQELISQCNNEIEKILSTFDDKILPEKITELENEGIYKKDRSNKNKLDFPVAPLLHQKLGSNIISLPAINSTTAMIVISEIGLDVSAWRTSKHFVSWLGLSPRNKISGGKILGSSTRKHKNRLAQALKFAASTLHFSNTYLGALYRKLLARLGAPKAINALARKLAVILYNMLKYGQTYVELGIEHFEAQYRERTIRNLKKKANEFGLELITKDKVA